MGRFTRSVADPNHYINRVIRNFAYMTDAPADIHEAYALLHLACACREFRWQLDPRSMVTERLNQYFVYYGPSGSARKSTVMRINKAYLADALSCSPFFDGDGFTPQGLRDGLVEREGIPTIVHFDEMEDILIAIAQPGSNMGQLPMMLKSLHSSPKYVTKLSAIGKKRSEQEIRIENSYLCMIGNVTPTIATRMPPQYLTDGLMARINIIMASYDHQQVSFATRRRASMSESDGLVLADERRALAEHLRGIEGATSRLNVEEMIVDFDDESMDEIDAFEKEIQRATKGSYHADSSAMLARMESKVVSIAGLVAAGRLGGAGITRGRGILVTRQDASDAVAVTRKLLKNATLFIDLCSGTDESKTGKYIIASMRRCIESNGKPYVTSTALVRRVKNKVTRREFDEATSMLVKAGELKLVRVDSKIAYSFPIQEVTVEEIEQETE